MKIDKISIKSYSRAEDCPSFASKIRKVFIKNFLAQTLKTKL